MPKITIVIGDLSVASSKITTTTEQTAAMAKRVAAVLNFDLFEALVVIPLLP